MYHCVFIIFSLLLPSLETTIANQLVVVGGGDDNVVINKCLDKEIHALLHFKALLKDPNGILSTWKDDKHNCCKWLGVTCNNQTGHVTGLDIGLCSLEGEISHSLANLTYLNHLDLSGNSFHGTIPRSIGSLTELRFLSLSNNSLYGTIPPEFGNLTNLQWLYLGFVGRCRVENPEWLSGLSYLEELVMNGISLAKATHWVDVILSLRKLNFLSLQSCELSQVMYPYSSSFLNSSSSIEVLGLVNNNLTSSMYHWLFPLTSNKLHELYLSRNMLDGIPNYLGNLCSLKTFFFMNNSVVVKFPDFLKNLSGCTSLALQSLDASYSQFTGSLSDDIQKFSSLNILSLSHNHLNGTISGKLWELPKLKVLDVSFNYLRGAISENIGKSKAIIINLSKNSIEGVASTDHMSNLSHIEYAGMSSCKLGPNFPKWIQTFKNLTRLDISNNGISDTIPLGFWDMWPSKLTHLNLSSNNISGQVPDLSSNFDYRSVIDLSSNRFYGPIPNVSSTLVSLNLSRNKFSGEISLLCQIVGGLLQFLDLSDNFLTGQLPDCVWHFKDLKVLNLGNNYLSGMLPTSLGYLVQLEALYLFNNNFSGELSLSLKNCTKLNFLDLGANKFFGNIPVWIGESLSGLYALILRSNHFFGTIPLQLCQLQKLQILDLSMNHLHGTIPSCLNNLTSMVQYGFSQVDNVHHHFSWSIDIFSFDAAYVDHAMIMWQGAEREFIRNLGLLKSIDLSSNNLTGKIPYELTDLYELFALNLSKNNILGEIPSQIGLMKKLLALDLSRNNLSGGIPSSMTQMTFLGYLDVSCNNLSGKIPSSTQLQSFEPSRYNGNTGLCGPPLNKKCPGDEKPEVPPVIGRSEGDGEGVDEVERWFYIGGGTGFVTGFWIACGALLLNRQGRHAFFQFYDSFKGWVYAKVVVLIANLQKVVHK
ncbi:receptor-like protein EIX2 [Lactuca sativa]|uniref:Leucine-rich repeat-containing N-terminal plant-type domain-containing protein n=1 Tax=Lactuca sativa TaxID=4236 RepID=A0A9R1VAM4_LACSA|nr:receptor-like protein EIX2 [Lactuca sativa]KAJ0201378.1 hypothetical protein LSAT_V11C600317860 [Lactuca sativa]